MVASLFIVWSELQNIFRFLSADNKLWELRIKFHFKDYINQYLTGAKAKSFPFSYDLKLHLFKILHVPPVSDTQLIGYF